MSNETNVNLDRRWMPAILAAAVLIVGSLPSGAAAQGTSGTTSAGVGSSGGVAGKMRLHVYGMLGFGGEAQGETEYDSDDLPFDPDDTDFDDLDMETTNGVGAEFDYALHRYFLLGGRLAFHFFEFDDAFDPNDDDDRSMAANLDVVPKGRLPIAGAPIEFYLAMPLGISMIFPNDDFEDDFPGDNTEMGNGASWNLSIHAGVQYWFNSTIGVFVEQGWYHQAFHFPGETEFAGNTVDFSTVGDFNQFAVNVGLSIGL